MHKYKTVVTDYEGMQAILDTHAAQGWRLLSLTPDTWRRTIVPETESGMDTPSFEQLRPSGNTQEYSASYYLLVFQRESPLEEPEILAAAEEAFPAEGRSALEP